MNPERALNTEEISSSSYLSCIGILGTHFEEVCGLWR